MDSLDLYTGADLEAIQEQYRRNSINQQMLRQEIKTMWRHERSTKRAKETSLRAGKTIEAIEDELDAVSSASSKYNKAVKAIDDACYKKADG